MSRIIFTADLHESSSSDDEYRWDVFDCLERIAKKYPPEFIIIGGDLTEKNDSHPSALVNRLVDRISRLVPHTTKGVLIYSGNHDYKDPANPFFKFLEQIEGVRFYHQPTTIRMEDHDVLVLPHSRKPRADWRDIDATCRYRYVFFHQSLVGARGANGHAFSAEEASLSVKELKRFKADLYVGGDIHGPQEVANRVHYVGSPHPVDFGDKFRPRILVLNDGEIEKSITLHTIKKEIIRGTERDVFRTLRVLGPGDRAKIYVRVPPHELVNWRDISNRISNRATKNLIHITHLGLDDTGEDKYKEIKVTRAGPKAILDRYCKIQKLDEKSVKAGRRILAKVLKTNKALNLSSCRIELCRLVITGFKTFVNTARINFPKVGLMQVTGTNESEPVLDSNGSGKSSVWDALSWVFYGKTVRGLHSTAVVPWANMHRTKMAFRNARTRGVAKLRINGQKVTIIRTRHPNTLVLKKGRFKKRVEQSDIDELLGMRQATFLKTVMLGQFNKFFFDEPPTQKLDTFSAVLGLDLWIKAAQMAGKEQKKAQEEISSLAIERGRCEGIIEQLSDQVDQLKRSLNLISRATGSKELEKQLADCAAVRLTHEAVIADLKRNIESATAKKADLEQDMILIQDELSAQEGKYAEYRSQLGMLTTQLGPWAESLDQAREAICDQCGQELDPKTRKDLISGLSKKIIAATFKAGKLKKKMNRREGKILELKRDLSRKDRSIRKVEGKIEEWGDTIADKTRKVQHLLDTERELKSKIDGASVDLRTNLETQLVDATRARASREKDLGDIIKDMKYFERMSVRYDQWADGFKQLRLWVVKRALKQLTIATNDNLLDLGLRGWSIRFMVEKPNKSGGVQRSFTVEIKSPKTPKDTFVQWEAWSGGETQRLRIAGAMGLSALIEQYTGCVWNTEIWDEPTNGIPARGIDHLMTLFSDRGRSKGVWIIDHRSAQSNLYTDNLHVTKNDQGESTVKQSRSG